jgi:hypothetical protein
VDIEFEGIDADGNRLLERLDRVLRRMRGVAAMADNGRDREVEERMLHGRSEMK